MPNIEASPVIVALGMPGAGGSLAAGLLGKLGANLGAGVAAGGSTSRGGSFEHVAIGRVSEALVRRFNRTLASPLGVAPFPGDWLKSPEVSATRERLRDIVEHEIAATGVGQTFAFSDPNTLRLLPLWRELFDQLGLGARYLLTVRNPASATAWLAQHERIPPAAAEMLWGIHHAEAVECLDGAIDCVITYEGWRERPEAQLKSMIEQLKLPVKAFDLEAIRAEFTDLPEPDGIAGESDSLQSSSRQLYDSLVQFAAGSTTGELLDRARNLLAARRMLGTWAETLDHFSGLTGRSAALGWAPVNRLPVRCGERRPGTRSPAVDLGAAGKVCIVMPEAGANSRTIAGGMPVLELRLWQLAERLATSASGLTVLFPRRTAFANYIEESSGQSDGPDIRIVIEQRPRIPCRLAYGKSPLARSLENSYNLFEYLKECHYDTVYLPDFRGIGYFSLAARQQGIRFENTAFVLLLSQPSAIVDEARMRLIRSVLELVRNDMEQKCLDLADTVIGTDSVSPAWFAKRGWRVPGILDFLPLPIPRPLARDTDSGKPADEKPSAFSLAFFGNLNQQNGIHIFCDALNRLAEQGTRPGHVYLVSPVQGRGQIRMVRKSLAGQHVSFHADLDHNERLELLNRPGVIPVVAVIHESASAEALECIASGSRAILSGLCPHLALLSAASRQASAVKPHPHYLAEKIRAALDQGMPPLEPSWDDDEIDAAWRLLLKPAEQWQPGQDPVSLIEERAEKQAALRRTETRKQLAVGHVSAGTPAASPEAPVVTVCLVHHERPEFVNQAIESLELQSVDNFEVILVDDGSKSAAALDNLDALQARFENRGWRLIRQANLSPGAARNHAASLATGRYLLFMDDDNYAKPHEIETFLRVVETTDADAITCFRDAFVGDDFPPLGQAAKQRVPALGSSLSVSAFINCFGDTNALVRKQTYEAVGGYNEQHRTGKEDYEFFCKLALNGFTLITIPEALFWYREHPVKRKHRHYNIDAGTLTVLEAFSASVPDTLRDSLLYARALRESAWEERFTRNRLRARLNFLRSSPLWKLARLAARVVRFFLPRR